jgi:hypothetical protein
MRSRGYSRQKRRSTRPPRAPTQYSAFRWGRGRLQTHTCAFDAGKRRIDIPDGVVFNLSISIESLSQEDSGILLETLMPSGEERSLLEVSRKPLAKVEGRRRMPLSGLTIAWRGTPSLDDWVAYIVQTKSKKSILAEYASERKVKTLLSRLRTMSKKEVEQLAKG